MLVYPLKPLASWVKDVVLLNQPAVPQLLRNAVPPSRLAVHLLPSAVLLLLRPAVLLHPSLAVHLPPRAAVLLHRSLAVHLLLRPAATPATAAAVTANCSTVASCEAAKIVAVNCSTVAKIVAAKSKFVAAK